MDFYFALFLRRSIIDSSDSEIRSQTHDTASCHGMKPLQALRSAKSFESAAVVCGV